MEMKYDPELAFQMVKGRMDRLPDEKIPNEAYIRERIKAAAEELEGWGDRKSVV